MKRIWLIFLVLGLVCAVQAEQRIALVIGNGAYSDAPLRNPPNDARAMAQALRQCSFEVIEKINSDQRTMEDAIRDFGQKIQQGGVGLFYYAGHGMQVQGTNYLIPVGAEVKAEDEVKYKAVDAGMVLSKMETAGNRVNIVILDACRNNPFARSFRSVDRGLKKMDAPKGTLLAYATAPGDVAADGEGANGLYTALLLKHLDTPGLAVEQVFKRVRADVMQATGDSQVPWNQSEGGVTWLQIDSEYALIEWGDGRFVAKSRYEDHPVVMVSWYGAKAYCEWSGKRLPTEEEWQQACQGRDGRTYPWGNNVPTENLANYSGYYLLAPVGSFPAGASPYGAMDMAGNVWEWTMSAESNRYVLRGGSWSSSNPDYLRCASRARGDPHPDVRLGNLGFRCAR